MDKKHHKIWQYFYKINSNYIHAKCYLLQGFEGGPPILLKEEPEDGPRSMQKVPSLSDLSDPENSLGKFILLFVFSFKLNFTFVYNNFKSKKINKNAL